MFHLPVKPCNPQEDDAALAKAHMARQGEILEALGSRIGALRRLHEEHVAQAAEVLVYLRPTLPMMPSYRSQARDG